jgi:hypothetical protein
MPTWGQILNEIQIEFQKGNKSAYDTCRNKYISELAALTERDTIVYASRWTTNDVNPGLVAISDEDIHAFMEAVAGLQGKQLDLVLHTGGGSAESAEAIISYLRQKYEHIRIIVPQAAMSAGTMLACSADIIVMGRQSSLGPIDPQFILQTSVGIQSIPAHAIIAQFEKAQKDCAENPKNLNSWLPMLSQYGPALLVRCQDQIEFSKNMVRTCLTEYMFKGEDSKFPDTISEYLSNHNNFKTHSKHINCKEARDIGLKIEMLEESTGPLQDKVLSAFHATSLTLNGTNTAKIVANHNGNCYMKQFSITPVKK